MALFGFSGLAAAQTSVTTSFSVGDYLDLTVSTTTVSFGAVTPGSTTSGGDVVATVKANRTYTLSYTAPSHFSKGGSPDTSVAIGCLRWNGTAFTTGANFHVNQEATPLDGRQHPHTYSLVLPSQALDQAAYSAVVNYVLAAGS
jgi:hypothetical protein